MLLEIVAFATDVCSHFLAIGQANTGHLAKRGVRLLGGDGSNLKANASLLRAGVKILDLGLLQLRAAGLSDELVDGRHAVSSRIDSNN